MLPPSCFVFPRFLVSSFLRLRITDCETVNGMVDYQRGNPPISSFLPLQQKVATTSVWASHKGRNTIQQRTDSVVQRMCRQWASRRNVLIGHVHRARKGQWKLKGAGKYLPKRLSGALRAAPKAKASGRLAWSLPGVYAVGVAGEGHPFA